ncbi:hypothetical protein M2137_001452 [Parabacteroides sp. PFB2-10]|uniref:hypothetical protein n=1 Tax=Parabacteroides sp. PFB2-10 TaxID=1742405 RepID=UPI002475EEA4|nr:hypothetical protein [Parabacteroides sp. PFB2-10]MDH6312677.1 hypothetical protein [Parabacteroides sp. PFB2-10]
MRKLEELNGKYTWILRCDTCASDDQFEISEDQSYIKCICCDREYLGGIEELKEYNSASLEQIKIDLAKDAKKVVEEELRKAFKGFLK